MQLRQQNLLIKLILWLLLEIALNVLGLDELADYSEFLLHHSTSSRSYEVQGFKQQTFSSNTMDLSSSLA